jgi:hypothetical protein
MLTRRAPTILRICQLLRTTVRSLALLAGAVLYVLAWLFAGTTGAWLALACNLVLSAGAWDAYHTVGGLIVWSRLHWWQAPLVLVLFAAGYLVPPVVIWRGLRQACRARQAQLATRPAEIARLERELGMDSQKRTGGMPE